MRRPEAACWAHGAIALALAMSLGCGCASRMTSATGDDIEAAYKGGDEAELFDLCQNGVDGVLTMSRSGAHSKLDDQACDRYGALQVRKLAAAVDKQDMATVESVCKDSRTFAVDPKTGKSLRRGFNAARYPDEVPAALKDALEVECRNRGDKCEASIESLACRVVKGAAAVGKDSAMEAAVATCQPETVEAAFTKAFGATYGSNAIQKEWFIKAGVALMKCGDEQAEWVLVNWLHWGSRYGEALADATEAAGVDLEKVILAHLKRAGDAAFNFQNGGYGADEAARWMRRNKRFGACKPLVAAYPKMEGRAQSSWLWYFAAAKCTDARPFAEALLVHKAEGARAQGCTVLGSIGDKRSVKKMSPLAKSDPAWKWDHAVKVYPVRDACNLGINQIEAR